MDNSEEMCDLETFQVNTPIGVIAITVCSVGVHRLSLLESHSEPNLEIKVVLKDQNVCNENKLINDSIEWLSDYFEFGLQKGVPVPPFCPNVIKSPFYGKVWLTLKDGIKFGQTTSYSDLAQTVDKPKASRAVGGAVKKNPFILMVPCHRVVKKDGTPGNYSAGNGSKLKEWLISFETNFRK